VLKPLHSWPQAWGQPWSGRAEPSHTQHSAGRFCSGPLQHPLGHASANMSNLTQPCKLLHA